MKSIYLSTQAFSAWAKQSQRAISVQRLPPWAKISCRSIPTRSENVQIKFPTHQHILPSEKAFAYKMRLEAIQRMSNHNKPGRPKSSKNNYSPLGNNQSVEKVQ